MKKQYIQPKVEIHSLYIETVLAATSPHVDADNFDGTDFEFPDGQIGNGDEDEAG